jgi:hypothetical protein
VKLGPLQQRRGREPHVAAHRSVDLDRVIVLPGGDELPQAVENRSAQHDVQSGRRLVEDAIYIVKRNIFVSDLRGGIGSVPDPL